MPSEETEKAVIESVELALDEVLGIRLKDALFWRLEQNHGFKKTDIPRNPKRFIALLGEIFGDGALAIERVVVKRLQAMKNVKGDRLASAINELSKKSP